MTTVQRPKPVAPRDRAFRLELTLQRPLLWGSGVVAMVVLLVALGQLGRWGFVPILLAVAVPVAAASPDTAREDWLRGTLAISRADHVRARVRFVLLSQLGLLLIAALVILVGPHAGGDDPAVLERMPLGRISLSVPTLEYWQDLVVWASAVLWTHIWVGRDALRSSSTMMWARALISYLGMCVVVMAVSGGAQMLVRALLARVGVVDVAASVTWIVLAVTGAVLVGGGLLVLRWRSEVWARAA